MKVMTTPEDLNELPEGSVVMDSDDVCFCRDPYGLWDTDKTPRWYPAWVTGFNLEKDFGVTAGGGFIVYPVTVLVEGAADA